MSKEHNQHDNLKKVGIALATVAVVGSATAGIVHLNNQNQTPTLVQETTTKGITKEKTNLLKSPKAGDEVLQTLPKGMKLTILEKTGKFLKVKVGNIEGYVQEEAISTDLTLFDNTEQIEDTAPTPTNSKTTPTSPPTSQTPQTPQTPPVPQTPQTPQTPQRPQQPQAPTSINNRLKELMGDVWEFQINDTTNTITAKLTMPIGLPSIEPLTNKFLSALAIIEAEYGTSYDLEWRSQDDNSLVLTIQDGIATDHKQIPQTPQQPQAPTTVNDRLTELMGDVWEFQINGNLITATHKIPIGLPSYDYIINNFQNALATIEAEYGISYDLEWIDQDDGSIEFTIKDGVVNQPQQITTLTAVNNRLTELMGDNWEFYLTDYSDTITAYLTMPVGLPSIDPIINKFQNALATIEAEFGISYDLEWRSQDDNSIILTIKDGIAQT